MKKNKKFKFGFTIMEMLITMLITILVAAAMVPVIGLKKVKIPINRYNKGIAECYYEPVGPFDANGDPEHGWQLMYYYADNKNRNNAAPVRVDGNYCTFDAPDSSFFEIIAIGPGTDSYYQQPPTFGVASASPYSTPNPYIRVDSFYQRDINSAMVTNSDGEQISLARAIRQVLNEWASSARRNDLYALYRAVSPIGAGGAGQCTPYKWETTETAHICHCADSDQCRGPAPGYFAETQKSWLRSTYPNGSVCWAYIKAAGTDSGKPMKTKDAIKFLLSGNSIISTHATDESAGFSVNGQGVTLLAAAPGNTATPNYENASMYWPAGAGPGADARCEGSMCGNVMTDYTMRKKGAPHGSGNGVTTICTASPGESAEPGHVYFGNTGDTDPRKLRWTYDGVSALVTQGTKGTKGEENTVIYENLKGRIYLMPAPYTGNTTNGVTLVRENPNDPATTLVQANSGSEIGVRKNVGFIMAPSSLPVPDASYKEAIPDNDFSYLSKLKAAVYNRGLAACDSNMAQPWCPGFGGKGQYFFLEDLPDINSLTIENLFNNGAPYTVPASRLAIESDIEINRDLCSDNITSPLSLGTQTVTSPTTGVRASYTPKYCREPGAKGRPGAVIILW